MFSKYQTGYTLIELLIVIAILLLVLGGSIAGWLKFSEKQTTLSNAQTLQKMVRSAQVKARAKQWPSTCLNGTTKVPVIGYRVSSSVVNGITTITLTGFCNNTKATYDTASNRAVINTWQMSPTLSLSANFSFDFYTNAGGVNLNTSNNPATVLIKNDLNTSCASFTVSGGGAITDAVKADCP